MADLLGADRQSLPVLILDGPPGDAGEVEELGALRYVSSGQAILANLSERHGFPRPHP